MGNFLSNAGKAIKKGVVDTGHAIGNAQNNKWVKGAEMAALAASGVGAPAAAAMMAGAGALGGTLRSGGGLKGAVTGAGQGALQGAGAAVGGNLIRSGIGAVHGGGAVADAGSVPGAAPGVPGAAGSVANAAAQGMGTAGKLDIAAKLMQALGGGAQAYVGAHNDSANRQFQQQKYNALAPIRQQALQGMQSMGPAPQYHAPNDFFTQGMYGGPPPGPPQPQPNPQQQFSQGPPPMQSAALGASGPPGMPEDPHQQMIRQLLMARMGG